MQYAHMQFEIAQLRQQNQIKVTESIVALILTFIFVSLVPQFLMIYVYQAQTTLMQQTPALVEYMGPVATAIGLAYVVFALVGNAFRESKARSLEAELHTMMLMDDGSEFTTTDEELMALEKIVDDALEQHAAEPKKTAKKTTKKKATRKSSTKKSAQK